jgi:hypothetical protein
LARVVVFLGFIIAVGCDAGDNVLTPPEGGAPAGQPTPKTPKANPKLSTRQQREKEAMQQ